MHKHNSILVTPMTSKLSHMTFMEIDIDIFSTVILRRLQIQKAKLSVNGERKCTSTGGLSLPRKSEVGYSETCVREPPVRQT